MPTAYTDTTFTWTFSGTFNGNFTTGPGVGSPVVVYPSYGFGKFFITIGNLVELSTLPDQYAQYDSQYTNTLHWINPSLDKYNTSVSNNGHMTAPGVPPYDVTVTGSYSLAITMTRSVVFTDGTPVTDPQKCGTLPYTRDMVMQALAEAGTTVAVTLTYGGVTVSDTATVTSPGAGTVSCECVYQPFADGSHTGNARMAITPLFNTKDRSPISGSDSDAQRTWAWGAIVSATAVSGFTAETIFRFFPYSTYPWRINVQAWDKPYNGTIKVNAITQLDVTTGLPKTDVITCTGGSGSLTVVQSQWGINLKANGTNKSGYPVTYSNAWPISATVDVPSLIANGEDPDLGNTDSPSLWFHGWTWSPGSLSIGTSLTLWTGSKSAVGTGGSITLGTSDYSAATKGTAWAGADFSSYAYMDLTLHCSTANKNARISFGGKYWDVKCPTSGTVRIDMLNPTSETGSVDSTDTQWPWTGPGSGPLTAVNGPRFGERNVTTFTIDHLEGGFTYTLTRIDLVKVNNAKLTCMDPFKAWKQAYDVAVSGTTSTATNYRRGRMGEVDGATSLEQTDTVWLHVETPTVTTDTLSPVSIASALNGLGSGSIPPGGWTGVLLHPYDGSTNLRDGVLCGNAESALLWGGGAYTVDGVNWISGIEDSTHSLLAQWLYTSMTPFFGMGDPFFGGSQTDPVPICLSIILRGNAWGTVADTNGRAASKLVTVKEGPVSDGSDTSDAHGEYHTGLPMPRWGHTPTVTGAIGHLPYPNTTIVPINRQNKRVCFFGPSSAGLTPPNTSAIDHPRQFFHVSNVKQIWTYNLVDFSLVSKSDDYAVDSWESMDTDERIGRLYAVGVSTTSMKMYRSDDFGQTGELINTVTANSAAVGVASPNNYTLLLFGDGSDDVSGQVSRDGGDNFDDPFVAMYNGSQLNATIQSMDYDPRNNGTFTLTCSMSGSIVVLQSTDTGQTWDLVLS